jgi:hypothetical protein
VTKSGVGGSYFYEEGLPMEETETVTKSAIQTAARETAASAKKLGGKLRTLAGSAADSSRRWATRCGEALSTGARFAALQAQQTRERRSLGRAHQELGRAVYALHGGNGGVPLAEAPELQAALQQVKEAEAALDSSSAKLAELRKTSDSGDSTSS